MTPTTDTDGLVERLRQIISECANALGNGAFISPEATVEFMSLLPDEIRGVRQSDAARIAELEGVLRQAAAVFRTYEAHHREKAIGNVHADDRNRKAERNADMAARIEATLGDRP